jgi:solute carrier family 35 protein E1
MFQFGFYLLFPGAGSVAFANVVKAGEPLCSVIMGIIIMAAYPSTAQVLTLVPIVAGVMIASMAEVSLIHVGYLLMLMS